jgi:hypothetical protein
MLYSYIKVEFDSATASEPVLFSDRCKLFESHSESQMLCQTFVLRKDVAAILRIFMSRAYDRRLVNSDRMWL